MCWERVFSSNFGQQNWNSISFKNLETLRWIRNLSIVLWVYYCEEHRLGLNLLNDGTDRRRVAPQDEDHPGNDPQLVPGFPCLCWGLFPERFRCVCRTCVFKRISSSLDRAPKIWDSVLLRSWDTSLETLPSISLETCVIYSSLTLATDVFREWPLLGKSLCVFLTTAAIFCLFWKVAIFLKGKHSTVVQTDFFIC